MGMPTTKTVVVRTLMILGLLTNPVGCSRPTNNPTVATNPPDEELLSRPPLPEEWAGRWQPDPFAGTEWIQVQHQARCSGPANYSIKGEKAVASLLRELKITAIHNDIARGNIPPAFLTFHKKGAPDLWCTVEKGQCLGTREGEIYIRDGFIKALNEQLTAQEKHVVNVMEFSSSVKKGAKEATSLPGIAGITRPRSPGSASSMAGRMLS